MHTQKWITLTIYIALALSALLLPNSVIATIALWFFGLLPLVHLLEYLVVKARLPQQPDTRTHHFLQTMIFGYVHWLPIIRNQR